MSSNYNHIPDVVRSAVELALDGDYDAARSALRSINYARLISERKAAMQGRHTRLAFELIRTDEAPEPVSTGPVALERRRTPVAGSKALAIFERDHFICRYSHCRKRTIHIPVLRALSVLFPEIVPYHRHWRPLEDHILYWTYATSLEHHVSFPHGGTSNPENLITACYQCNDTKNMIRADELGWKVADIQDEDWQGLNNYLPALKDLLAAWTVGLSRPTKSAASSEDERW